jgi:hypothetical protein
MATGLTVLAILAGLFGAIAFGGAVSAFQEVVGTGLLTVAAVLFAAAAIVRALDTQTAVLLRLLHRTEKSAERTESAEPSSESKDEWPGWKSGD